MSFDRQVALAAAAGAAPGGALSLAAGPDPGHAVPEPGDRPRRHDTRYPTAPTCAAIAAAARLDGAGGGHGQAERSGLPAVAVQDHRAGHRYLRQHARDRRRADPHQRRANRRQGLRAGGPEGRAHRHRRVRRHGFAGPGADLEPGGVDRGGRSLHPAAGNGHRQRLVRVPRDAVSRCRHRSGETGRRQGARKRVSSPGPARAETGHSARRPQSRRRKSRSCPPAPTRPG